MADSSSERRIAIVPARATGQRLDRFLHEAFPNYSRRQISQVIKSGEVLIDGRRGRPGTLLSGGERMDLPVMSRAVARQTARARQRDRRRHAASAPRDVEILHRDDELLVVSKPPGVPMHGGAELGATKTLLDLLKDDVVSGFRLVHRLDRDTSGVVALVRGDAEIAATAERFAASDGGVVKIYEAIVEGVPDDPTGEIDLPLTPPRHRGRVEVSKPHGRPALTRYAVLEAFAPLAARLRLELLTGRTHQIRVHVAALGHPLLVDRQYGRRGGWHLPDPRGGLDARLGRTPLHATELTLPHPRTEEVLTFHAKLPADMKYALEVLRVRAATGRRGQTEGDDARA